MLISKSFVRPLYPPVAIGMELRPSVGEAVATNSRARPAHVAMESAALQVTSCYAVPTNQAAPLS